MKSRARSTRNRPPEAEAADPGPGGEGSDLFAPAEPRAHTQGRPSQEPPAAMVNPVGDMRRLHRHAGASAAELRHFLAQLRGRSPAEMLGAVASSNLVRGTAIAAIGTAALLLLATAIPFAFSGDGRETSAASEAGPAATAPAAEANAGAPASPSPAAADAGEPPDPSAGDAPQVDPVRAAEALGVNEERQAPPDVNPLENAVDDLLRDLE